MSLINKTFNQVAEGISKALLTVLPLVIIGLVLLLLIPECSANRQPAPTAEALEMELPVNGPVILKHCHQEQFKRFARPNWITICVRDGFEIAITDITPPPIWMMQRYPEIVDSLRRKDPWSSL